VPGAQLSSWAPPRNAFTQLDREFFGLAKDGLTADAFWQAILREWWRRTFLQAWGILPGGSAASLTAELAAVGLSNTGLGPLVKAVNRAATLLFGDPRFGGLPTVCVDEPNCDKNLLQHVLMTLPQLGMSRPGAGPAPSRAYIPLRGPAGRSAALAGLILAIFQRPSSTLRADLIEGGLTTDSIHLRWTSRLTSTPLDPTEGGSGAARVDVLDDRYVAQLWMSPSGAGDDGGALDPAASGFELLPQLFAWLLSPQAPGASVDGESILDQLGARLVQYAARPSADFRRPARAAPMGLPSLTPEPLAEDPT
jgi:hypothetical protein